MAKKQDLLAQITRATGEYCALADKTEDEGFEQESLDNLEKTIEDLKSQVARVERAEKLAVELATPAGGTVGSAGTRAHSSPGQE